VLDRAVTATDRDMTATPFWSGMTWLNPPAEERPEGAALAIRTRPRTDFWQETHYGFRRDDGHFLYRAAAGDFAATVDCGFAPVARYDQAGLMVRLGPGCWLKTSVEFEPDGPAHLGAVVTNRGLSDWSMTPLPAIPARLAFRVVRAGPDYRVLVGADDGALAMIRLARLHDDDGSGPVLVGPYACSPTGEGCEVRFHGFALTAPG
jgi:regulation of enolase protein 1 (concanavalin A-like superfamily)